MIHLRQLRLALPAFVLGCLVFGCCGTAEEPPAPGAESPSSAGPADEAPEVGASNYSLDVTTANSCRKIDASCSSSQKCCAGGVCLNSDLYPDGPDKTCHVCGGADQLCCGVKRAQNLTDLAKRCTAKNTVCPQGESTDYCEPCGHQYQACCIEKGKSVCHDRSKCERIGKGGPGKDAYPGMCL